MKEYRVIIAGSRSFDDDELMEKTMDTLLRNKVGQGYKIIIVSGRAKGADQAGERYAKKRGYDIAFFPADWSLGKKAGPLRNRKMGKFAIGGGCACFWDGQSRGTMDMISVAKEYKLQLYISRFNPTPVKPYKLPKGI